MAEQELQEPRPLGEIARAHGGELRAHSTAGDGTTFELLLPRTAI